MGKNEKLFIHNSQVSKFDLSSLPETVAISRNDIMEMVKTSLNKILSENIQDELMVYHGTTSLFNKFDMSFVGSGEGSQVYGWGVYLTDVKDTGRWYAATIAIKNAKNDSSNTYRSMYNKISVAKHNVRNISEKNYEDSKQRIINNLQIGLEKAKGERPKSEFVKAIEFVNSCIDFNMFNTKFTKLAHMAAAPYKRYVYDVDIPDDNYIDWNNNNKQFLIDIFNKISQKFDTSHVDINKVKSFGDMFEKLRGWSHKPSSNGEIIPQKELSLFLYSLGYNGIMVPTGNKRGGDGRGSNYVVFNDKDVKIIGQTDMTNREDF